MSYYPNFFEIDNHWKEIKKWWDIVIINNELLPKDYKKISMEDKINFKIKFLYFIQNINNLNWDMIKDLIEDDNDIKNILLYISSFNDYFEQIKKKFIEIIKPLFNDIYFDKLFRCDDDLTRLFCPIGISILYIYIVNKDVEKTINIFLTLDTIYIEFIVISYLILDNFMDDNLYCKEHKSIFFKWFMNIVNNPEQEIIINEIEENIYQCIVFKKYYIKFIEKYPFKENKKLYSYVKLMIDTLIKTNIIQKNENITNDIILECTFKKTFVVCIFMILIINIQLNKKLKKSNFHILCKLFFLLQLSDDYMDIKKDIIESNNTYFTFNDFNFTFDNKIKKIITSCVLLLKDINKKNIYINDIIIFYIKYLSLCMLYVNVDKFNIDLINYFEEYSYIDINMIRNLNIKSYNQYVNTTIIKIFKNYISNQ